MADIKALARYDWKYIIVDEGHRLKNFNCKLIKDLRTLPAANKLLLTGACCWRCRAAWGVSVVLVGWQVDWARCTLHRHAPPPNTQHATRNNTHEHRHAAAEQPG
jgi:hypothetical protein